MQLIGILISLFKSFGGTALMQAAAKGYLDIVIDLLNNGADVNFIKM